MQSSKHKCVDKTYQNNILRRRKIVLVQLMMLNRSPIQRISPLLTLNQKSASGENRNLSYHRIIDVMISHPYPIILHIYPRSRGRDVHTQKPSDTLWWNGAVVRLLGTLGNGELGTVESTDAGVDVPEAGMVFYGAGEVVFYEDGAGLGAFSRDD